MVSVSLCYAKSSTGPDHVSAGAGGTGRRSAPSDARRTRHKKKKGNHVRRTGVAGPRKLAWPPRRLSVFADRRVGDHCVDPAQRVRHRPADVQAPARRLASAVRTSAGALARRLRCIRHRHLHRRIDPEDRRAGKPLRARRLEHFRCGGRGIGIAGTRPGILSPSRAAHSARDAPLVPLSHAQDHEHADRAVRRRMPVHRRADADHIVRVRDPGARAFRRDEPRDVRQPALRDVHAVQGCGAVDLR